MKTPSPAQALVIPAFLLPSSLAADPASFQDKCSRPGVLLCAGFDSQAEIDAAFSGSETHVPPVYDPVDSAAMMTVPSE